MERINLVELLKDCIGMELDCAIFNNAKLEKISFEEDREYPIRVNTLGGRTISLTQYGTYIDAPEAKCIIFPKGKTTWEGFVPPYKFKDGDVITCTNSACSFVSIFKKINIDKTFIRYASLILNPVQQFWTNESWADFSNPRLATEEEKQELFDAIKANGYKWNPETKTLEKLSKFKVGDRIIPKDNPHNIPSIKIKAVTESQYILENEGFFYISSADEKYVLEDKFDINTLVPFESRVLVRDNVKEKWHPAIWGFYDSEREDYPYKLIGDIARYCIPYEGNEHLLGKTDDCSEYFKTWIELGN